MDAPSVDDAKLFLLKIFSTRCFGIIKDFEFGCLGTKCFTVTVYKKLEKMCQQDTKNMKLFLALYALCAKISQTI